MMSSFGSRDVDLPKCRLCGGLPICGGACEQSSMAILPSTLSDQVWSDSSGTWKHLDEVCIIGPAVYFAECLGRDQRRLSPAIIWTVSSCRLNSVPSNRLFAECQSIGLADTRGSDPHRSRQGIAPNFSTISTPYIPRHSTLPPLRQQLNPWFEKWIVERWLP